MTGERLPKALPLHGGGLGGGVATVLGRRARLGAGAKQRLHRVSWREHPQPCMEGEGFDGGLAHG